MLHSLDTMRVQPGRAWLRAFAAATRPNLDRCSGHGLATMAGAMGRLWQRQDVQPGSPSLDLGRVEDITDWDVRWNEEAGENVPPECCIRPGASQISSQSSAEEAYVPGPDSANASGGGSLGEVEQPDSTFQDWVRALLLTSQRRMVDHRHAPSSLSRWPQRNTGGSAVPRGKAGGGDLQPEDMVCIALAMPSLLSSPPDGSGRHMLPKGWLVDLRAALLISLPQLSPMQLSNALMALARIHRMDMHLDTSDASQVASVPPVQQQPLEASWLREWLLASARSATSFNAADVAQSLWALAAFGASSRRPPTPNAPPPPKRTAKDISLPQHESSQKGRSLQTPLPPPSPVGHLQLPVTGAMPRQSSLHVPGEWVSLFLSRTRHALGAMSPSQLSMTVWSLSVMGVRSPAFQVRSVRAKDWTSCPFCCDVPCDPRRFHWLILLHQWFSCSILSGAWPCSTPQRRSCRPGAP